jgi:hypothetical protein
MLTVVLFLSVHFFLLSHDEKKENEPKKEKHERQKLYSVICIGRWLEVGFVTF